MVLETESLRDTLQNLASHNLAFYICSKWVHHPFGSLNLSDLNDRIDITVMLAMTDTDVNSWSLKGTNHQTL